MFAEHLVFVSDTLSLDINQKEAAQPMNTSSFNPSDTALVVLSRITFDELTDLIAQKVVLQFEAHSKNVSAQPSSFLTAKDVAKRLVVSKRTLESQLNQGEAPQPVLGGGTAQSAFGTHRILKRFAQCRRQKVHINSQRGQLFCPLFLLPHDIIIN